MFQSDIITCDKGKERGLYVAGLRVGYPAYEIASIGRVNVLPSVDLLMF